MDVSLAELATSSSQLEFSCEFLTQKELDLDAVAFNSNYQRYHFPKRLDLPFRGVFGQFDPIQVDWMGSAERLIRQMLKKQHRPARLTNLPQLPDRADAGLLLDSLLLLARLDGPEKEVLDLRRGLLSIAALDCRLRTFFLGAIEDDQRRSAHDVPPLDVF
jgi:hypothetical protein